MSFSNMLEILQEKNKGKIVLIKLGVNVNIEFNKNCKVKFNTFCNIKLSSSADYVSALFLLLAMYFVL